MKRGSLIVRLGLAAILVGVVFAPQARADSRSGSLRALGQVGRMGASRGGSHGGGGALRGVGDALRSGGGHGGSRNLDGLRNLGNLIDMGRGGHGGYGGGHGGYGGGHGGYGDHGGGHGGYGDRGGWGGYGGGWGGYGGYDSHRSPERYYADAMRDTAIINGVVDIFGMALTAPYGPQTYVQTVPVAPAPVYVAPAPRYRTERVLVRQGYYEEAQQWVPDMYDSRTGETIRGHYVTRQRWVPEVWEERQVQY